MGSGREWKQQVEEKFFLQEEQKEEKCYPRKSKIGWLQTDSARNPGALQFIWMLYDIFWIIKEKQRFSKDLPDRKVFCKQVFDHVRVTECWNQESPGNICKQKSRE